MKKILVANIFGIGDVLFTTPLVSSIKKEIPGASVDYLCNARTEPLIRTDPAVSGTIVYEKDDLVRAWRSNKKEFFNKFFALFNRVRSAGYDAVFDLTLSREFGLLFFLCGIPERIGFDHKKRGVFLTKKKKLTGFGPGHVVNEYLGLLGSAGIRPSVKELQLTVAPVLEDWAGAYMKEKFSGSAKRVAIIPGAGASWGKDAGRKRASPGIFSEVGKRLSARGYGVGVLGDASEASICLEVAGAMNAGGCIVETSLDIQRYAALLSRFDLVVSNDGGPLHMAVALGLKTVSIFGPVDEKVYGPYPLTVKHRVVTADGLLCRPCYRNFRLPDCREDLKCVKGIDPGLVLERCLELLG
jgi:ADP-heptose:LPS heptosyltransferase